MAVNDVNALNNDLAEFAGDVFRYLVYQGQRDYGRMYLRGLMLDGKRKSVEPMACRLGVPRQNLNHFVGQSNWDYTEVMRRIATRAVTTVAPTAWVVDDHPFRPLRPRHRRGGPAALRRAWPASVPGRGLGARAVGTGLHTAALAAVPATGLGR